MRGALTTLAVALALLVPAATASGGASHAVILGAVPHADPWAAPFADPSTTIGFGPVDYHDGQVMQTNTTYAIYWAPSGFSDASYESLINRYFGDVAAASGSASNVYAVATQYYDNTGAIRYKSTFGGSFVDTDPFPTSGCGEASICLTDAQLQAEIQKVLTRKGWHGGTSNMFFLMTPDGVASCANQGPLLCSTTDFCAYHSDFFNSSGEEVIYADEPYAGTLSGCTFSKVGKQGFPNDHDADATINTISHEHNEAISDPFGDAWWAADGGNDEIADLCAGYFGSTPLGTANGQPYHQLINGHPYSVQEEYSNDDSSCAKGYTPRMVPSIAAAPVLSGPPILAKSVSTTDGSWAHAPSGYAYQWQRCRPSGAGCTAISGATAATYLLTAADIDHVVRSTVSAHNAVGGASPVASDSSGVVGTVSEVGVPKSKRAPRISGRARVGRRLTAARGSWSGPPKSYRYQWLRCNGHGGSCRRISNATHVTYRLTKLDSGHRLRVRVSAVNAAGAGTASSKPTARVPAAF
jgi:hypothetical protein